MWIIRILPIKCPKAHGWTQRYCLQRDGWDREAAIPIDSPPVTSTGNTRNPLDSPSPKERPKKQMGDFRYRMENRKGWRLLGLQDLTAALPALQNMERFLDVAQVSPNQELTFIVVYLKLSWTYLIRSLILCHFIFRYFYLSDFIWSYLYGLCHFMVSYIRVL